MIRIALNILAIVLGIGFASSGVAQAAQTSPARSRGDSVASPARNEQKAGEGGAKIVREGVAPPPPSTSQRSALPETPPIAHASTEERLADWTVALVFATAALVLATVGVAVFTAKLAADARATAGEQRALGLDANTRTLRAYLSVSDESVEGDVPRTVHLVLQNDGRTPAYKVAVRDTARWMTPVTAATHDWTLPNSPDPRGSRSIGPGRSVSVLSPILALDDLTRIRAVGSEAEIWAWGEIAYEDAFKVKRVTRFRLKWKFDTSRNAWLSRSTAEGNEST